MPSEIHTAPPDSGTSILGKTLPSLLYDAADRYVNPEALNQPDGEAWRPVSLTDFRRQVEETALGLVDLGLERGDRVALFMESDVHFCLADMGCLVAGLIDVPIYLTHASEQIRHVLDHSGSRAVFVTNEESLRELAAVLPRTPDVRWVIVAELRSEAALPALPHGVAMVKLEALRERGRRRLRADEGAVRELLDQIDAHDLATIIYTSGTTGQPKGVMLSHENVSHNALTSFSGMTGYRSGHGGEVTLSFLPLSHIFARTLHYGFLYHGSSVYFTTPENLSRDLKRVRPTVFATVPRVLEKVYGTILKRRAVMTGVKKRLLSWALDLARRHRVGQPQPLALRLQRRLADRLVYAKWREALGGRVEYVISGGAALSPELTNIFGAAGIQVLQGYGLTESSPVIAYNRPGRNRPGTVGVPIPGVEVRIADDGEIVTRGPHVMMGYYRDEERTREVIDEEGWLHTGDVGGFDEEGHLCITDRKKDLFKLSTGKYVMPQPLENRLTAHPLVEQAVVVGSGYKFCTALIFPDPETVRVLARSRGLDANRPVEELVKDPVVVRRYAELVERANRGMDHWSTIKRFALVPSTLTIEEGLLTPTMKVKRTRVHELFADHIEALYQEEGEAEAPPSLAVGT